jgi:hypothetical protein
VSHNTSLAAVNGPLRDLLISRGIPQSVDTAVNP